ncbi:MAG: mechanosensitive ion channel, partial [Alphaproteobacteria bacterium]|nr:mechanosensitive ion channel [Alphaproteobacteria bacterium]
YIVMRRRDGMEALIPNETLMVNQVINWSYSNRAIRQEVDIRVSYDSDMEQVREILLTAVKTVNRVLEVPPPVCFIREFADSSVVFLLRYWSNDPENGVNNLKGAVNMAAWKALKEAGVKIPYPQHVLHMAEDNPPKRKKQWRRKPKISSDIG